MVQEKKTKNKTHQYIKPHQIRSIIMSGYYYYYHRCDDEDNDDDDDDDDGHCSHVLI